LLTAYIQFGAARDNYEEFFDMCSRDPDGRDCSAAKLMIETMKRPSALNAPETMQQLADHLHCRS
jgi:hypothetical protein